MLVLREEGDGDGEHEERGEGLDGAEEVREGGGEVHGCWMWVEGGRDGGFMKGGGRGEVMG